MKTFYYYVYNDETFSRPYTDMQSVQADIASMGAPHHVRDVVSVNYRESCGMTDGVESMHIHPVWWKHWRDLEIAKQRVNLSGEK